MEKRIYLLAVCVVGLFGCDKGISPIESPSGFGGTITYVSAPPSPDSLMDLRIVAVPYYPVDTVVETLIQKLFSGAIPYSGTLLPVTIDSGKTQTYQFLLRPGVYKYVAVVQQYGVLILQDWRVIGIYGYSPSSPFPGSVTVSAGRIQTGIDFIVDFKNLPPQPFKE